MPISRFESKYGKLLTPQRHCSAHLKNAQLTIIQKLTKKWRKFQMKMTYAKRNGHERYKFVHKNSNEAAMSRRKTALQFLENQLVSGKKIIRDGDYAPLEEEDKDRIKKEIASLKIKLSIS